MGSKLELAEIFSVVLYKYHTNTTYTHTHSWQLENFVYR